MSNSHLVKKQRAKQKDDEFYTRREDIDKELPLYTKHFKGKVVYCNCDLWYKSHFVRYFNENFKKLKLKRLIVTNYVDQLAAGETEPARHYMYDGTRNSPHSSKSGMAFAMKGDGDFRSPECIELLKQADIVVTNPPFSLLREFIKLLYKHEKKFLSLAPVASLTYNDISPKLISKEIFVGKNSFKGFENERKGVYSLWLTNLQEIEKPLLIGTKKYNKKEYPKYDNFDAINVNKMTDVPCDYYEFMGVPITALQNYDLSNFEVKKMIRPIMDGKEIFRRILIKRSKK